jgi:hypothetical protein
MICITIFNFLFSSYRFFLLRFQMTSIVDPELAEGVQPEPENADDPELAEGLQPEPEDAEDKCLSQQKEYSLNLKMPRIKCLLANEPVQ